VIQDWGHCPIIGDWVVCHPAYVHLKFVSLYSCPFSWIYEDESLLFYPSVKINSTEFEK
jgi:hypothetical protein